MANITFDTCLITTQYQFKIYKKFVFSNICNNEKQKKWDKTKKHTAL